ncbi:MAG: ComF family protein [Rikenellaceae bacterium]|nr:ComF family protein [Rikenellaceae bacterium]
MRVRKNIRTHLLSLFHLFIPQLCVVCGWLLVEGEQFICTACRWHMPLTYTWTKPENPIRGKMYALFMAEQACALFFYEKHTGYADLVHRFKYNGKPALAHALGTWLGQEMKLSGYYDDIDLILPVPLHPLRRLKRGYNQSEHLSRGIARALGKPVSTGNLVRTVHNRSQTLHDSTDRWENVSGIFVLRDPKKVENKHILLVDDVLTTGATLDSCAEAIRAKTNLCRISVAVLTASARDFQ